MAVLIPTPTFIRSFYHGACSDHSIPPAGQGPSRLRPLSIPGALRTIRRSPTSGTCERDSSRGWHSPICQPLAFSQNSPFASCTGSLKPVGSVAVSGLVGAPFVLSLSSPGVLKRAVVVPLRRPARFCAIAPVLTAQTRTIVPLPTLGSIPYQAIAWY